MWLFTFNRYKYKFDHFYINFYNKLILSIPLYSFRLYIQFLILFFLLFLNFKENLKFREINNFFYIFLIYNVIQIISLFLSENNNLNIIYNICSINVLLFLNLIFYKEKQDIKKIFFFLIFTFFIFTWYYFESILN